MSKDKNKQVHCTKCRHFRLDDELIPYCPFEDNCDIEDCEDGRNIEERPMYEESEDRK